MDNTFHIITFGCQMNKLDSEMLRAALINSGMRSVSDVSDAGVVIYNTCSVRQHAEDKVMSHLGRWRKKAESNPGFLLGVVGCMAERLGEAIVKKFPFVRFVCGTRSFLRLPDFLEETARTGRPVIELGGGPLEFERDSSLRSDPHHAYVSIMRGCSNFCAYCIVPHVRGPEVSRPLPQIVDEVKRLADEGVAEVTLLGQNVNAYGRHRNAASGSQGGLPRLLGELGSLGGIRRLRFITSHPKDMSEDILKAVADNERVCEHLHMPVQSASDRLLRAMNRNYTRRHYMEVVEKALDIVPEIAFSSDFIVGFPGETDRDFQETLSLLRDVRFQQSYIFRYSPRPGTAASGREDDVSEQVKRRRQQQLLAAQQDVDTARRRRLIGGNLEVLCTGANTARPDEGRFLGRSRHHDIVVFDDPAGAGMKAGGICHVTIDSATSLTLFGRMSD